MSEERFRWLEQWVADLADIVRTPGSESNVQEIYDTCAELGALPDHVVFNQFCEFGNHLAQWLCTSTALQRVFEHCAAGQVRGEPPRDGLDFGQLRHVADDTASCYRLRQSLTSPPKSVVTTVPSGASWTDVRLSSWLRSATTSSHVAVS